MHDQFFFRLKGDLAAHLDEFRDQVGLQPRGRLSDDWDQEFGHRELRPRELGWVYLSLYRYEDDDWMIDLTYEKEPLPTAEAEQLRRTVLNAAVAAGMTVTAQSASDKVSTKALSVWRADPGSASGVAPDESLPRLSTQDAERVADYLDAGAIVARTTARMVDSWSGDTAARVPLTQRTDGVWRWDDAVSYYVRHYHLNPGAQFVADLRERDFALRSVTAAQVSAVADEVFGSPGTPPQHLLRLDGSQLLPRDTYCSYQGRVFRCDFNSSRVKLIVSPGETIPAGFQPKDARGSFVQSIAYKAVAALEIEAFYRVITTCWYKGDPYSIRRIDGPALRISLGGGRRVNSATAEPPHPTRNELGHFPNIEVLGPGDVWADIDILEAARLTMAIVPYHLVDGHLKPVRDLTGAGYAVPTADQIFYFPSPLDSPYLPPGQAAAVVRDYLQMQDPSYPTTKNDPQRLRDGWLINPARTVDTLYYVADDGQVMTAPADAPTAQVSSQLSAHFRQRHPVVDPPPVHDTGTDIFD